MELCFSWVVIKVFVAITVIMVPMLGSNSTIGLGLDFSIIAVGYYFPFVLLEDSVVNSSFMDSLQLNFKLVSRLPIAFIKLYEIFVIFA